MTPDEQRCVIIALEHLCSCFGVPLPAQEMEAVASSCGGLAPWDD